MRFWIRLAADTGAVRRRVCRRRGPGPGDDPTGRPTAGPLRRAGPASPGSATDLHAALDAQDASYDAVFDFGIVHHIPDWRNALAEVARVLRPGGRFYFEEVTAHALARPTNQRLFDHPREDRFTAKQFLDELAQRGLVVLGSITRIQGDYLLGAATKPI